MVLSQLLMMSPAQARHHEVFWTTTLTVADARSNLKGCNEGSDTPSARCSQALSSNTFTHDGVTYTIVQITTSSTQVIFQLESKGIPNSVRTGALRLDGQSYSWSSAVLARTAGAPVGSQNYAQWRGRSTWTAGQAVTVSLTGPAPQTLPTLDRLPYDDSVDRVPASQRTREDGSSYCYLGEGNGTTEYIRYSNGRIREVPRQSAAIRSTYACH